jgi:ATP-dependent Clp protease ATP-binding subunit ClpB
VGFDEGGALTETVRRRPYTVVLFDEIEKAHPEVFNVLLQLLEDGRLTDGHGRTVDFKNTVVIMTSNIGSDPAVLRDHFRPEFLNRIDDVLVFESLEREHIRQIVEIQTRRLQALMNDRKMKLVLTDKAKDLPAAEAHHPAYGAGPPGAETPGRRIQGRRRREGGRRRGQHHHLHPGIG